jgi:hypothetical protein
LAVEKMKQKKKKTQKTHVLETSLDAAKMERNTKTHEFER